MSESLPHTKQVRIGLLVSILASISFGLYPAAAKAAYLNGANSIAVIIITTFARAAALVFYCVITKKPLGVERGRRVSVYAGGFCQACSIFGIIGSLAFVPAAVTIVVMFSHTIMLMFFMAYRGDLKLTGFMSASTVSALFGLSLVVDVWTHAENIHPFGVFLAFVAALATAMRLYLFGKEVLLQHPIVVGAQIFSVAAICTLFLSLYQSPVMPHSFAGYGWIGACSLALILGTFGMFYGIALIGSFQWSLMAKLEPVFTAIFAFGVLGEILTVYQYLGIALVIGSLFLYQWVTAERRRKS